MSNKSQINSIDLVCGYKVNANSNHYIKHNQDDIYFCSEKCKKTFERNPDKYLSNNYNRQKKITSILNTDYFNKILEIKILTDFSNTLIEDISKIFGVFSIKNDNNKITIKYNSQVTKEEEIIKKIEEYNYKFKNILETELVLFIEDIDLFNSYNKLIKKLQKLDGINNISFNSINTCIYLNYNSNIIDKESIKIYINKIGYKVTEDKPKDYTKKINILKNNFIISGIILLLSIFDFYLNKNFLLPKTLTNNYIYLLLATIVQFILAKDIYLDAFKSIIRKDIDNNFLVIFSSLTIYIYSVLEIFCFKSSQSLDIYFDLSISIITIFTLYKYFIYLINSSLIDNVNLDKIENLERINKDDILFLSKDSLLKNDFLILEGNCIVDELFKKNIIKNDRDIIKAGSIIKSGNIKAQAINNEEEAFTQKINKFIQKSFNLKIELSYFNSIFINYFNYYILFYSLGIFLFEILKTNNISLSFQYFIFVMAFVIPFVIPISLNIINLLSIKIFNDNNIFPKDFNSIFLSSKIKNIIIDKSIIIKNEAIITDIVTFNGYDGNTLLKLLASAENICPDNNISKAVLREVRNKSFNLYIPDNFEYFEDMGFIASINGYSIMAGNKILFKKNSINIDNMKRLSKKISENGKSLLYITIDNKEAGIVAISNYINEEVELLIKDLNKLNQFNIFILSGDSFSADHFIAESIGIKKENIISELSEEEKIKYLKKFIKKGKLGLLTKNRNNKYSNYFDIIFSDIENIDINNDNNTIFYRKSRDIVEILKYSKFIKDRLYINFTVSYIYYILMIIFSIILLFTSISIFHEAKFVLFTSFTYLLFILINSLKIRNFKL